MELSEGTTPKTKKSFFNRVLGGISGWLRGCWEDLSGSYDKLQDLPKANYELGVFHLKRENISDAILRFRMALWMRADFYEAKYQLARCYIFKKNTPKALEILKPLVKEHPDYAEAQYLLAALDKDQPVPEFIPVSIVEEYFNDIAEDYNHDMLGERHFKGHHYLAEELAVQLGKESRKHDILELGCGTGLSGVVLREKLDVATLTGVDVAENMLRIAEETSYRGFPVYEYLRHSNMFDHLAADDKQYHAVAASLVFGYCGALAPILQQVRKVLYKDGLVAFSVLKGTDEGMTLAEDMKEFFYTESVIRSSAEEARFDVVLCKKVFIYDQVPGYVTILQLKNKD